MCKKIQKGIFVHFFKTQFKFEDAYSFSFKYGVQLFRFYPIIWKLRKHSLNKSYNTFLHGPFPFHKNTVTWILVVQDTLKFDLKMHLNILVLSVKYFANVLISFAQHKQDKQKPNLFPKWLVISLHCYMLFSRWAKSKKKIFLTTERSTVRHREK